MLNEGRSLIPFGLRVPIWKRNFCSRVLQLSELHRCKETPQSAMCCIEWQERLKCMETGLHASLSLLSKSRRCSRRKSPGHLSVSPIHLFLQQVHISMHILHAALYTFFKVLIRRICLTIKSFLNDDHFLYSHDLSVWFIGDIVRRNLMLITPRG